MKGKNQFYPIGSRIMLESKLNFQEGSTKKLSYAKTTEPKPLNKV